MWLFNRYMFFSRTSTTYPLVSRLTRQPRSRPSAFTRNVHVPAAVPSNLSYHAEEGATSAHLRDHHHPLRRDAPARTHVSAFSRDVHVPAAVPSNLPYHGEEGATSAHLRDHNPPRPCCCAVQHFVPWYLLAPRAMLGFVAFTRPLSWG